MTWSQTSAEPQTGHHQMTNNVAFINLCQLRKCLTFVSFFRRSSRGLLSGKYLIPLHLKCGPEKSVFEHLTIALCLYEDCETRVLHGENTKPRGKTKGRIGIEPKLASLTTLVVHIMNAAFIEELTLELQTTAALYLAIQTKQHKGTDPSLRLSFRIPTGFF